MRTRSLISLFGLLLVWSGSAVADEQAQASAKELEAVVSAELKSRAPKRIWKLVAEKKKRAKKGKRARGYQYTPRVLKRLWSSTPKPFQEAFKSKPWTEEVIRRQKWLGYPLTVTKPVIKRIVVHRKFASVFWEGEFTEATRAYRQDSHAHLRVRKAAPLPNKKGHPSSVWFRSGKEWRVAVRPTRGGKWEEHNAPGDPLRATPEGFDPDAPSAAEVCAGFDALEDRIFGVKKTRETATQALDELKASMSGLVIWDIGVVEQIRVEGRGMRRGSSILVRAGHALFDVSDQSIRASDHYAKVKVGSLVAFRGTFDTADRSAGQSSNLELTRPPYRIYLKWPRSKDPATLVLETN